MTDARSRRALIIFLVILTVVVLARAASSARGATQDIPRSAPSTPAPGLSMEITEPGDLLPAGGTFHRTLLLRGRGRGAPSGRLDLDWETRVDGVSVARGSGAFPKPQSGVARFALTIPLPALEKPAGMELEVRAHAPGGPVVETRFPFTLYPADRARQVLALLAHARIALYDPAGKAGEALRSLGLSPETFRTYEALTLSPADLIIIGPSGFTRDDEALGPVLAARARSGTPILLLDQPNLPGTLSEDLRLWPAFSRASQSSLLLDTGHPVLLGLPEEGGAAYLAAAPARARPLLPPTRGNFRILAETRVGRGASFQEGVALLEYPIGDGTVLAAQASLCSDYATDSRARILLVNTLAYLLQSRQPMRRTFVYGGSAADLPACLLHLAPRAPAAPPDLEGVDLLLVPADWQAPRLKEARGLPPLARLSRFLRDGGTLVLLSPQSLVLDYLRGVSGANVYFEAAAAGATYEASDEARPLLRGIMPEDLALLDRPGQPEFRLRTVSGHDDGVRSLLVAPGLALYRVGRGTLLALSLPDTSDCSLPRTSSLLARLLTNLGVPLDPGPGVDKDAITLLNE